MGGGAWWCSTPLAQGAACGQVAEALGGAAPKELRAVRDVGARAALSNSSLVLEVEVNATGARFLRVTPA